MAVYGGLEETMEKYGDFSVSAIQTLTTCVRKCQRKQGSDDPDFQYQRGTKNLGSTFVPGWYCLFRGHRVDFPNLDDLHKIVKQHIPHDATQHSRIDR